MADDENGKAALVRHCNVIYIATLADDDLLKVILKC